MRRLREWAKANTSFLTNAGLLLAAIVLLGLLTWGFTRGNLAASVISGAGLALTIAMTGSIMIVPDDLRSQATERTLIVASSTLRSLSGGLTSEGAMAVCQLLLPETRAAAIAVTDTTETLAYVGDGVSHYLAGSEISAATREVLESGRVQTFSSLGSDEGGIFMSEEDERHGHKARALALPVGIFAPLMVADKCVGTIKLYYHHGREVDRTQIAIARGYAELLSTQLSTHELEIQAELTARAEVKALQAQINPHFLFNALNTMASLTRTDPAKARDLLREFSVYYRRTLESSQTLIPLSEELAQTKRYLKIEKARFGEDRIIQTESVDPGLEQLLVPGFIVQPLVENAVRHAMREEGPLRIDIQATVDGDDVLIAVVDDGLGMTEESARKLTEEQPEDTPISDNKKGTGIAIRNVAERIDRFYGEGSGVEIMSKVGAGTAVTLRLAGVASQAPKLMK